MRDIEYIEFYLPLPTYLYLFIFTYLPLPTYLYLLTVTYLPLPTYHQVIQSVLSVATNPVNEIAAASKAGLIPQQILSNGEVSEVQHVSASFKDVAVYPEHCVKNCNGNGNGNSGKGGGKGVDSGIICDDPACQLCLRCVGKALLGELLRAYNEHVHRGMCRRVIPPPLTHQTAAHTQPPANASLNADNTLMSEWFRGKCILDAAFCN